jgi:very-short-patch-repair endonuclease
MAWRERQPTALARTLRANTTEAERHLWGCLRARQVTGVRVNRQVRVGPYVCDFAARSAGLVVDVDGGQHVADHPKEIARTALLEREGYRVIRFWNHDVLQNVEGLVAAIESALRSLPRPLPQAGGEKEGASAHAPADRQKGLSPDARPASPPACGRGRGRAYHKAPPAP